jgi:hypothetical protein
VATVLYSALPVEYPPTTDEGVAIVFSLEKNSIDAAALHTKATQFFHDVRFIILINIYYNIKIADYPFVRVDSIFYG